MTIKKIATSAQNKAMELYQSRDNRSLHQFLENWKRNIEPATTDYVIAVINHFSQLVDHSVRPDLIVGPLLLKFTCRRAFWKERDVDLTISEFKIVKALADQSESFFTYRAIYDVVHYAGFAAGTGVEGYQTNVRSLIKRIRRKFEAVEPGWNGIQNYAGHGYRWVALSK